MITIRLGTRGSRLALAQTRWVASRLREEVPSLAVEIVEITTLGDRLLDVPLGPQLGQSFFTKEIEGALLDGRIDVAVHSCKDLATALTSGVRIGAVPSREDPRDALVSSVGRLDELPPGARVGTGSPRRRAFLAAVRPDLLAAELRGNVPTRVGAVDEGRVDAAVLALAGLRRLGLGSRATDVFDEDVMLPAAGQGALALQVREDDPRAAELVAQLDDADAHAQVRAERSCLGSLEAGCLAPVGALARTEGERITLRAAVASPTGIVRARASGGRAEAEALGARIAASLLGDLGLETLRDLEWTTASGWSLRSVAPS